MTTTILRILVGFVPVLLFLAALIYLDSYKLIKLRSIILTIIMGAAVAGLAYLLNSALSARLPIGEAPYSRYVAPILEETLKALFLVYLIRSHKVGFLVDAAIYGFAVGAGFALTENIYYLKILPDAGLVMWLVRGCGTAIMHGGTTAIFGVVSKTLSERESFPKLARYLPGLLIAFLIHSAFNHFFFSPILSTLGIIVILPPLMMLVFERSEKSLCAWLNVGFDADTELLELIESGAFSQSKVGLYLHSLTEKFRGEIVADLLCYLRIHVELSMRAKGVLMMRESGIHIEIDEATRANFKELEFLEKSIGKTGKLAVAPFLHVSDKDLWQMYVLGK